MQQTHVKWNKAKKTIIIPLLFIVFLEQDDLDPSKIITETNSAIATFSGNTNTTKKFI